MFRSASKPPCEVASPGGRLLFAAARHKVPCHFTSIPTPNPSKPSCRDPGVNLLQGHSATPSGPACKNSTPRNAYLRHNARDPQPAPPGARVSATVSPPRPPESPRRRPASRAPALPPEAPRQRGQAGGPERPPRLPRALRPAVGARRRRRLLLTARAAAPRAGTAVTTAPRPPHLRQPRAAANRRQPPPPPAAASRLPSASPPSLRLPQQPPPPLPPPPLGPALRHVTAPRDPERLAGTSPRPASRPRAPPSRPPRRGPASRPLTHAGSGLRGAAGLTSLAWRSAAAPRPPASNARSPRLRRLAGPRPSHSRALPQLTHAPLNTHRRAHSSPTHVSLAHIPQPASQRSHRLGSSENSGDLVQSEPRSLEGILPKPGTE
ncbi:proline-rich protein HaeIII subfamily 1-like [Cervus elaphus]|uniref:proline-rich protein HaeIII subfamily 1-like n=1 Tax=Cervus elaphus TaxID=9860 RepID=UPI001CC29A62|nr:proline-rich protein HaeIII subfamily 1-like [Cervus elaphus]